MMFRRFREIRAADGGTAMIELALIAPVLALMVVGIADISTAYGRKLSIEQAAQRAIEKVMQTTGETTVEETIQNEAVCQINGTLANGDCADGRIDASNVTVTYRLECTDNAGNITEQESSDAVVFDAFTCTSGSTEARYISTTVTDTYAPLFPIHFGTEADGTYHLSVTAGVRVQ
jgi:Flp pilus assembly protein TadG